MKNSVSETKEMKSINSVIDLGSSIVGNVTTLNVVPLGHDVPELVKLVDIPKYFQFFTVATLRQLVFNAGFNGFAPCVRRLKPKKDSKKPIVLIHVPSLLAWLDENFMQV